MSLHALWWPGLLTCLLAAACATDLHTRRIPNPLTAAVLALGLAHAATVTAGAPAGGPLANGLTPALLGVALGLVTWLPLYALGLLGAGDVKLFAAAGAWIGPHGVLPASVFAAFAGGALAVAWIIGGPIAARRGRRARTADPRRLPYGLAITAGVLAVAWGAGL